MKKVALGNATASLAEYARQIDDGPLLVTERGKPLAALVSVRDADAESLALSMNPKFLAILERSRQRHETEGGISPDEMRRRLGLSRATTRRGSKRSVRRGTS